MTLGFQVIPPNSHCPHFMPPLDYNSYFITISEQDMKSGLGQEKARNPGPPHLPQSPTLSRNDAIYLKKKVYTHP